MLLRGREDTEARVCWLEARDVNELSIIIGKTYLTPRCTNRLHDVLKSTGVIVMACVKLLKVRLDLAVFNLKRVLTKNESGYKTTL